MPTGRSPTTRVENDAIENRANPLSQKADGPGIDHAMRSGGSPRIHLDRTVGSDFDHLTAYFHSIAIA
jgi:hypothetical protein